MLCVSSERKHHNLYALFLQTLYPVFCLVIKFLNMSVTYSLIPINSKSGFAAL